ncbi:MAG TPA: rhodanese-like domain-containing protein [Chitinophaga sp.]
MQNITAEELKARMDNGETLHIIDVREPHEHEEFNIGGLLLPLGDIRSLQTEPIDALKEEEVIVYCRSGNRSGQACMVLDSLGFTNTKNLVGGMMNWEAMYGR